jgi:2-polyprenyl-6-methoxyphenol hydroxylase-like FAD-dependent oxidoreductase
LFQIGGSIAGLMCGVMLKHHGHNVTILEQASLSRQGYDAGIKIGPEVEKYLEKHDDVKRDMRIVCKPGFSLNANGEPKVARGQTIVNTSWGLFTSVLRTNFDGSTSKAVPVAPKARESDGKALFISGARVLDVKEVDGGMQVEYGEVASDKKVTLSADIVVVADGTTSSMRSKLMPEVERQYTGYMCWRGTVQEEQIDDKWNKLYAERTTFHLMDQTYMIK